MPELYCTNCRKNTEHSFKGKYSDGIRWECNLCGFKWTDKWGE